MKKLFFALTLLTSLTLQHIANAAVAPELAKVFIETDESDNYYGDAIRIVFSKPMFNSATQDTRVNHNPNGNSPKAPAGYSEQGGQSAVNAAKNYLITIIPEQGSNTQAFTGTWKELGGKAVFDPHDPEKKTILLLPAHKHQVLFRPGDDVEITIANTIQDLEGVALNPSKNKKKKRSS